MNDKLTLKELYAKRKEYEEELDNLHMSEPGEHYYKIQRYKIECNIAFIEDAIEYFEKEVKMKKVVIKSAIVVGLVISGLLSYVLFWL
jgi:hypothetical protein